MRSGFSHIVTADKRLLQFCTDDLTVVVPRDNKQIEWDWRTPDAVKNTMGIAPKDVPTYLALADPSTERAWTIKQAIRLIELYGNVDSIYRNLGKVGSSQVRTRLAECEFQIRKRCGRTSASPPTV